MASSSSRSAVLPIAMAMFGIGLLAIILIFGLFATGHQDLPAWISVVALLCPAGLIFGVIATVVRARRR
jgi:ABC-type multidrug transport system permease subunit